MKSHFLKENDVVLSSRWQFEDGRSKGIGYRMGSGGCRERGPPEKSVVPSTRFLERLKGTTEDEVVGWHHQLNGHEFE